MINCPYCGKLTDPKLASCPHCGGPMRAKPQHTEGPAAPGTGPRCPNCRNPVQEGDIICVRCGTNLLTGQKIAAEQEQAVKPRRNWAPVLLVGIAAMLLFAALGGLALYITYDPVAEAVRLSRSNPLEALNRLQQYVDRRPGNVKARLTLGKLHWQARQFGKASEEFSAASRLDDTDKSAAWLAVAGAAKIAGPEGRNLQVAALQRVTEVDPDNPEGWRMLALAQGPATDPAAGQEAWKRATALGGGQGGDPALAAALALSGDYDGAAAALGAVVDAAPGNSDAAAALAMVESLQGDSEKALPLLEEAAANGSAIDSFVKTRLGLLLMGQGDYEKALPLLRDAAAAANAYPSAAFFHALCLQQAGLTAEAMVDYDRIMTAGGEYAGEAGLQLATLFLEQDNAGKANDLLSRAKQLGGASARAYTIEGRIRLQEGDQAAAQQAFLSAVKTDPDYSPAHLENGLLYIGRGVLGEGLRELEQYLALVGEDRAGTRATEIEVLVEQLKQTMQKDAGAAAPKQGGAQ
jgi:predicted Zn-dependent protease